MNPWSPQQREWLQALGHSVFVLAGSENAVGEEAAPTVAADPGAGPAMAAGSGRSFPPAGRPAREDAGRVQLARDAAFAPARPSDATPQTVTPAVQPPPPAPARLLGVADAPVGAGAMGEAGAGPNADPVGLPPARGDVAARAAALSAALRSGIPQPLPPTTATADDAEAIGRLRAALLRATGRDGRDAETVLAALGVKPAALRANPEAKRALWPRLRRQRRQAGR